MNNTNDNDQFSWALDRLKKATDADGNIQLRVGYDDITLPRSVTSPFLDALEMAHETGVPPVIISMNRQKETLAVLYQVSDIDAHKVYLQSSRMWRTSYLTYDVFIRGGGEGAEGFLVLPELSKNEWEDREEMTDEDYPSYGVLHLLVSRADVNHRVSLPADTVQKLFAGAEVSITGDISVRLK